MILSAKRGCRPSITLIRPGAPNGRVRRVRKFEPLPLDDPKRRRPGIDLAESTLGWKPKIALEDRLRETIAYFRERLAL